MWILLLKPATRKIKLLLPAPGRWKKYGKLEKNFRRENYPHQSDTTRDRNIVRLKNCCDNYKVSIFNYFFKPQTPMANSQTNPNSLNPKKYDLEERTTKFSKSTIDFLKK